MPLAPKHKRILLFAGIALAGTALDLATKTWAWSKIGEPQPKGHELRNGRVLISYNSPPEANLHVIGDRFLVLRTTYNPGAFAGLGSCYPGVLLFITILMVPIIVWCFYKSEKLPEYVCLAMILGGTLGNMYDRMMVQPAATEQEISAIIHKLGGSADLAGDVARVRAHMVRDFISADLGFYPFHPWPTFNVADSLLTVGVFGLFVYMVFFVKKKEGQGQASPRRKKAGA